MFKDVYLLNGNEFELFTMIKFIPYTLFYHGKNGQNF
jgi:hypothetical protein